MAFQAQDAKTISWFYAAAFGRTPVPDSTLPDNGDLGGLIFWTDAFIEGDGDFAQFQGNLDAIGDFFVASDEFQARYPDAMTNEQFVTALYNNMLNRDPDLAGFNFWVNELNSGQSRGAVLVDFANTPENQGAIPDQSEALDSFILRIANDDSMPNPVITPDEAATWLAANPDYDAAVVDLPLDTTAPTIDPDQTVTYSEGSTADAALLTVAAADNEGGSGIESFAIVSGNDKGYFQIDADGNISLTTAGAAAGTAANSSTVDPDVFTLGVTATDRAGNTSDAVDVVLTVADVTPPAVSKALVGSNSVILAYDETLNSSKLPLPTDFAVTQNGTTAITVNTVTISGSSVTLGLAAAATGTITVSYTPNADADKQLQDPAGNVAAALTNQATQADTTAPTLVSSVPADNATDVAVGSNIVLTMSETVKAGTGNIIITNSNDATDTRTISVTDTTQVTFSGASITINPTVDLKASGAYVVAIGSGVITDLVGNAFAGISGSDLNFSTPGGGGAGQTFTLTSAVDSIPGLIGSLGTTDNSGDDIIIGNIIADANAGNTVQIADQVNGGTGIDTFKEFLLAGAKVVIPQLSNTENFFISGSNTSDVDASVLSGVTGLEINLPGAAKTYTLNGATQAFTLSKDSQAPGGTVYGANLVYSGTDTSAKITVSQVGNLNNTTTNASAIDAKGAALGTLNLDSAGTVTANSDHKANGILVGLGAANVVKLDNTGSSTATTTLNIAGSTKLYLDLLTNKADFTKLATVNASTDTGGVWVKTDVQSASFAFTGGSGNDLLQVAAGDMTAITSGAQLNGGSGTDTLVINDTAPTATDYTAINKATNFEVLGVGTTATTIDVSKLTSINSFYVDLGAAGTTTFNNSKSISKFQIDNSYGQTAVTITNATGETATTINLDNQSGASQTVATLTPTGASTINLVSTGNTGASNVITALKNGDNSVINVTGDTKLTLTIQATATGSKVDATSFNGALVVTGDNFGDVLIGGSKADTFTTGTKASTLTGNAGNDTFTIAATVYAATKEVSTITDFTKGDLIGFANKGTETFVSTKVDVSAATTLAGALGIATNGVAGDTNAVLKWFQFGGNTYVVEAIDTAANHTGTDATAVDVVIKLTGVLDLSGSIIDGTANTLTFA